MPTAVAFAGLTVAMVLRAIIVLFGDLSAADPLQDDMRAVTQLLSTISLNAAMCGFLIMINELLRSRIVTLVAYDELTGMLSRRGFLHQAQQLCQGSRATRTPVAVLMMDLDHFSAINGAIGHEGGDQALVALPNWPAPRCVRVTSSAAWAARNSAPCYTGPMRARACRSRSGFARASRR